MTCDADADADDVQVRRLLVWTFGQVHKQRTVKSEDENIFDIVTALGYSVIQTRREHGRTHAYNKGRTTIQNMQIRRSRSFRVSGVAKGGHWCMSPPPSSYGKIY